MVLFLDGVIEELKEIIEILYLSDGKIRLAMRNEEIHDLVLVTPIESKDKRVYLINPVNKVLFVAIMNVVKRKKIVNFQLNKVEINVEILVEIFMLQVEFFSNKEQMFIDLLYTRLNPERYIASFISNKQYIYTKFYLFKF